MSVESSQSKKWERRNKKVHTQVNYKKQWCISDVCGFFLFGTASRLSVEWHCTDPLLSLPLSKLLVHIWRKYNLGAHTWQTEEFHAMLPCQGTRAMPCWTQSWWLPHTEHVRGHINKRLSIQWHCWISCVKLQCFSELGQMLFTIWIKQVWSYFI